MDKLWDSYGEMTLESILITCHYPVSPSSFVLMYGMIVKRIPGLDDETMGKVARKMTRLIGAGFLEDVKIWQHKTRIENPLLCEADGPVYQLRRWYEQFYVDVEDVTDDMVARYEFEVDTTRAVQTWEAEVAANQARAAS